MIIESKNKTYVSMVDNFMSGWGESEGKQNIYQIECDNIAQADQIKSHALTRSEMTDVKISDHKLTDRNLNSILVSNKTYSQMGGVWIENGGRVSA